MSFGKVLAVGLGLLGVGGMFAFAGGDAKADDKPPPGPGPGPGPGGVELLSCETALSSLPADMKATVDMLLAADRTAENVKMLRATALTFEATAAGPSVPPAMKNVLMVAATCLRKYADDGVKPTGPIAIPPVPAPVKPEVAGDGASTLPAGSVIKDENGVPSAVSGPAVKGVASNPAFQWLYPVAQDDNAFAIAARFFGSAATWTRAIELIKANPREHYSKRYLGEKGSAANPQTTGYNWANAIQKGDRLIVPKSWNGNIDQQGYTRRDPSPFPSQVV